MRTLWALSALATALAACGTITVDDVTVMEDDYHRSRDIVLNLATTALPCPRHELTTKVLAVTVHANILRMQISGCDKEVVYTRTGDGFAPEAAPPLAEP